MPNTSTIAFALIVGYIVFIVVRGELPVYLGVIGFGPDKNNTCANTTTTSTNSVSGPVNVSNPTTINILQNSGTPLQSNSPVIVKTGVNAPPLIPTESSNTNVNFDLGTCDALDANGNCVLPYQGSQSGGLGGSEPPSLAPLQGYGPGGDTSGGDLGDGF